MGKRKPPVFPEPVWAHAIRSRPPATMGMEYFWTGVGVAYLAYPMFSRRTGSIGGLVNSVTGSGTPLPEASTGMSAYLSKLIPVPWGV